MWHSIHVFESNKRMPVSDQLIDQLLADYKSPEDLLGEQGILKQLTQKLAERTLEAEMELHLGYAKHDAAETT